MLTARPLKSKLHSFGKTLKSPQKVKTPRLCSSSQPECSARGSEGGATGQATCEDNPGHGRPAQSLGAPQPLLFLLLHVHLWCVGYAERALEPWGWRQRGQEHRLCSPQRPPSQGDLEQKCCWLES